MSSGRQLQVLIAGGGVAALEAALALRALAEDRVALELLAPELHFWYRPMSVAEPFAAGATQRFELPALAAEAGAAFTLGALHSVDAEQYRVLTDSGAEIPYDVLLVAAGAVPSVAVPGAVTFRGPADVARVSRMLEEIGTHYAARVAFAIPLGAVWSLPAYELALLTARHLEERGRRDVTLAIVSPEDEPLQLFGAAAVQAGRNLLAARGIEFVGGVVPVAFSDGALRLVPGGSVEADRVLALPRLRGPRIAGLPSGPEGFIPVDAYGRVLGVDGVYAAGDVTTFPLKQGGIASQQADVAAAAIAARAGAPVRPLPFRPVLRGLLLTGDAPRYLRRDVSRGRGEASWAAVEPLWWPPAKIVGRHLAPFLASHAGAVAVDDGAAPPGSLSIEVELDPEGRDLPGGPLRRIGLGF